MKWSKDGTRIATGSYDKTVQVWSATTGQTLVTYNHHTSEITSLAWSPNSTRIVSGAGYGGEVEVWDAATGGFLFAFPNVSRLPLALGWSHDGSRIAVAYGGATSDAIVEIHDASNGRLLSTYLGHTHTSGYSGGNNSTLLAWWEPLRTKRSLSGSGIGVFSLAWSPDDSRIASGEGGSLFTAQVWDTSTLQTLVTYHGHTSYVDDVLWSPDGKRVASASDDSTVQIWQAR